MPGLLLGGHTKIPAPEQQKGGRLQPKQDLASSEPGARLFQQGLDAEVETQRSEPNNCLQRILSQAAEQKLCLEWCCHPRGEEQRQKVPREQQQDSRGGCLLVGMAGKKHLGGRKGKEEKALQSGKEGAEERPGRDPRGGSGVLASACLNQKLSGQRLGRRRCLG